VLSLAGELRLRTGDLAALRRIICGRAPESITLSPVAPMATEKRPLAQTLIRS